ncbi:hypothetical protein [Actinacidiphila soli]|uniref:hypothetical protein n=1 Tax=Actinacidiphila soli TaxID=2487275 RepID=UPI0013E361B7
MVDLKDDCGPGQGSVFVHGDHLARFEVTPLRGIEGRKPHRGSAAGREGGHELDPHPGGVEGWFAVGGSLSDVLGGVKASIEAFTAWCARTPPCRRFTNRAP